MGGSAKAKWNAEHYRQMNISVKPAVAAAFKAACDAAGVSMAGVLTQHMAEYGAAVANRQHTASDPVSTRRKRRKILADIVCRLEELRDAEEQARDNTPENLQGTERYEAYDDIISGLDEAIELLGDLYS